VNFRIPSGCRTRGI